MWWSPNPRMVLFPSELKISNSLAKTLKKINDKTVQNNVFEIRFNSAFREVITACSQTLRNGQPGTWITQDIIEAYSLMHDKGYAISAECWLNDQLVGGCYGVKIGKMFYGESMFHHITDASKVAFVSLVQKLKVEGIELIDCQMKTAHLSSLGAQEISRDSFARQLFKLLQS